MPADLGAIVADLRGEHADLDARVAPLAPECWDLPTPAAPWSIRDQISHLSFFDDRAALSAGDPDAFTAALAVLVDDPEGYMQRPLDEGRAMPAAAVLARWRERRDRLCAALLAADPSARLPWYGPPMGVASFATARLMETWAHGQDVADALGVERTPTARLRHVAHIAVKARAFNYAAHGRPAPAAAVHVALRAPGGEIWTWEDPALPDAVSGSALDFCLVTTQRRHRADTDVRVEGRLAEEWMAIAQAFAGPPGPGRRPGQFRRHAGAADWSA